MSHFHVKICIRANFSAFDQAVNPFELVNALVCIRVNFSVAEQSSADRTAECHSHPFVLSAYPVITLLLHVKMISLMTLYHLEPVFNVR